MVSYLTMNCIPMLVPQVLILIVVDDGLVRDFVEDNGKDGKVLILIVVDDGLVLGLIRHY